MASVQLWHLGRLTAYGRPMQGVVQAHFDVERLFVHGCRRIEFIEIVRFERLQEVLPSRDGKLSWLR